MTFVITSDRENKESQIYTNFWSSRPIMICLFVWFDSLRPINKFSVIKGRVFLGQTSTKLELMFFLKDTMQWRWWGSNLRPLSLESSTLPLSHCAPKNNYEATEFHQYYYKADLKCFMSFLYHTFLMCDYSIHSPWNTWSPFLRHKNMP